MTQPAPPGARDLPRIVFGTLLILALGVGSFWILRPFLPALIWATMIVAATWPLLVRLERRLRHRRGLAVALLMVVLLVVVVAPLVAAVWTLAGQVERLSELKSIRLAIPGPPAWVAPLPLVGEKLATEWQAISAAGPEALASRIAPYTAPVGTWLLAQLGGLGGLVVHLLLTYAMCGVLYATGDTAAHGVRRFFRRLHGERGDQVVVLAGASIRAVALGIVVTAVAQTLLGAIGLAIAGVPFVALLAAALLVCCIAQIGPFPILLASVGWLWYADSHGWAIALAVWSVFVGTIDNFLRPMLIKRGADLPILLIMAGVIGGLLAFGLVGLFVGPVLLAVTYTLLAAWVDEQPAPEPGTGHR
ncbi:MAG: AI-2E family transporter YdiK [Burkholderiales bacterium]